MIGMRPTKYCPLLAGFSLIELLLVTALIGLIATMSTTYLLGAKEKSLLQSQADLLLKDLKISQQNAVAAYKGQDYTVSFDVQNNTYTLQPEIEPVVKRLLEGVAFEYASPDRITFQMLTGEPEAGLNLSLETKRFTLQLEASANGLFKSFPPTRK